MENKNSEKLENKIMSEIKSGKVKLRSKYFFLAEKLGLESAFILSVILAVLFFNLFFFYLKTTDNLEYLSFGTVGILAFLESFPYLLIISFILFLFIAGYLITKADFSYKKPFKYFAVILIVFVMFVGTVLSFTNISEKFEKEIFSENSSGNILRPFLNRGMGLRNNGLSGKIFEVSDNYLVVEIPSGLQKVNIENLEIEKEFNFEKGQFVIIIGERKDNDFRADKIKIVNENRLLMIERGIHRNYEKNSMHYNSRLNNFLIKDEDLKKCMYECLKLNEYRRRCFDSCDEN